MLEAIKNWSGAADAVPLRLKLNIFLPRLLFVLSVQSGAVHFALAFLLLRYCSVKVMCMPPLLLDMVRILSD